MKAILLLVAGLVLTGAAAGIQPAEVENTTLRLELNASEVFRSGLQTTPGEYQPSDYPYLSSGEPEALVPYGDTEELTNIYMPDGLVAYYPLDETSGDTANDVTTALPDNDGANINFDGGELGANGNISAGYELDGSNELIRIDLTDQEEDRLGSDRSGTVAAWVATDTSDMSIFSTSLDRDRRLKISNGDLVGSQYNGGFNRVRHPISGTGWRHVAFSYIQSNQNGKQELSLYIDGSNVKTETYSSVSEVSNGADYKIGIGPEPNFNGIIDDFRMYNRSLSQKEVQRLYNYQAQNQPGTEQFSATVSSGGFILANTKGGTPSIQSRSESVRSRTFLSQVDPSFGFPLPQSPPTTNIVYRSPYNLTGDSFSSASSRISIRNTAGLGENATVGVKPIG